jgi:hypothetical protein
MWIPDEDILLLYGSLEYIITIFQNLGAFMRKFPILIFIIIIVSLAACSTENDDSQNDNSFFETEVAKIVNLTSEAAKKGTPTSVSTPTAVFTATATPTITSTPEDFSDLIPCESLLDAKSKICSVTHDDVVSGRLIRMAKAMSEPFDPSISPAKAYLDQWADSEIIYLRVNTNSENKNGRIVYVFNYEKSEYTKYYIVVEKFKNADGSEGYLQFIINKEIPNQFFSQLSRQFIIMPEYSFYQSEDKFLTKNYEDMIFEEEIMMKYYGHIQSLFDQWMETGNIPEELSLFLLETHNTTSRYQ